MAHLRRSDRLASGLANILRAVLAGWWLALSHILAGIALVR
ncbi:hypothetical protein [Micromonospora sp. B9E7]